MLNNVNMTIKKIILFFLRTHKTYFAFFKTRTVLKFTPYVRFVDFVKRNFFLPIIQLSDLLIVVKNPKFKDYWFNGYIKKKRIETYIYTFFLKRVLLKKVRKVLKKSKTLKKLRSYKKIMYNNCDSRKVFSYILIYIFVIALFVVITKNIKKKSKTLSISRYFNKLKYKKQVLRFVYIEKTILRLVEKIQYINLINFLLIWLRKVVSNYSK